MSLFGAHMSIAGGYHNALLQAQARGCEAVQLFTHAPNQWMAKGLSEEEVLLFRRTLRQTRLRQPTAHDCYLTNLASPDEALYRRSLETFLVELQRADRLGLRYLVMHPGAHLDSSEEAGLARVAAALDEIHNRLPACNVRVLLETTAGQGSTLGYRFEHLAHILSLVSQGIGWVCASIRATSSRPATPWRPLRNIKRRCGLLTALSACGACAFFTSTTVANRRAAA